MQAVILARKLDEQGMSKVRKFCNSLPFTWLEAGSEERNYVAVVDIPLSEFQTCIQQVEMHLVGVGESYEVTMLDPAKTRALTIPDEMFEEKRGWRLYTADEVERRASPEAAE
jgi:hypothetical protein